MSQENVEIVREAIEAFNRRDVDAFLSNASPEIEWEDSEFWSEHARIYRGRAEVREWFNQVVLEPWESVHVELEEITEAGADRIFFGACLTTRGRGSGVETQIRGWQVVWIADGKVTRRQVFLDRAEALEAAGLEE
jgi:ketosteroid isomerase-like protein